ncbi:hypothetical protein H4R24_001628 [Coemansia sp. RSA 988]|nr:hypothetical protein H4R24_001628 [Coemansia sp. RSA 988]
MYTLVTLVLKPVLWILAQLTLNFLPESIQYDVIEIVFEFIVKATEGYPLLLIGVCAKPVALKVYTFILTQFSAETNRDLNKEKEDGEYIAIGVQMAPPEVVNAPAENNINGIAANELHRPYNVMEPIAEIENNNFEYDDVEDNSDNEDEVIDARIQAIQANINAVEERIQHIRNEIQAQQEPDALMVVDIAWIDDLGFFGVDRDTVKLYLKTLINAQFAIALFVWVPYIVGIIKGSLPSDIYYKHMQQAINSALKSTYPSLAFTLYPNSMSVPGNHFMKIPQNRLVRVPVDGFGFPVDSIYDYEVADSPRQRQKAISEGYIIPYPAPHNETVDMRFKWMDYRVIYVPSMIEIRELVYMALTLFGMGMVVVTALTLALYIGGYILHPIYDDLKDTASPLYLGILVIFAIDVVGNYTMQTFAKTFTSVYRYGI